MSFNVRETLCQPPKDVFDAIKQINVAHQKIFDLLHLLESIMLNSDIDKTQDEIPGLISWKQRIMKELMKHGYSWDGSADDANKLFGEGFGYDWR